MIGQTLDNSGKDIRTVTGGVAGIGDLAEVYAVENGKVKKCKGEKVLC